MERLKSESENADIKTLHEWAARISEAQEAKEFEIRDGLISTVESQVMPSIHDLAARSWFENFIEVQRKKS